jgi:hypothetical protein
MERDMSDKRDWRDAKLPAWAKDAVQAEIDQWRLTAALAWPTQAKPQPLPFGWGGYDRISGTPYPGTFWAVSETRIDKFDLARRSDLSAEDSMHLGGPTFKTWVFRTSEGGRWHTGIQRGPLFDNLPDAKLYRRWMLCEKFARELMKAM